MKNCKFGIYFILINTAILGIIAGFSHFAYPLSGDLVIVGLFNPVNESVWEHLKFMFFPNLAWWIIMYYIQKRKCTINLQKWIIAAASALVAAPLLVILLFYSYTGALGIESVIVDIALVFICFFTALRLAFHLYAHVRPSTLRVTLSIAAIVLIFLAFLIFTFYPPHIPLFYDTTTGTYGI